MQRSPARKFSTAFRTLTNKPFPPHLYQRSITPMGDGTWRTWRFLKRDEQAVVRACGYDPASDTFETVFGECYDDPDEPGVTTCEGENTSYTEELAKAGF